MLHVVCNDIIEDSVRVRVSDCLLGFGTRIQDSVFECLLDDELLDRLVVDLGKLPLDEKDRIRIYQVCARCVDQMQIYGPGVLTESADFLRGLRVKRSGINELSRVGKRAVKQGEVTGNPQV